MSTRSRVGIVSPDGTVTSIYCHFDGYWGENGIGYTLRDHYKGEAKVRKLMAGGDTSNIDPELEDCRFYKQRGETDVDAHKAANKAAFFAMCTQTDAEWAYLFDGNKWEVYEAKSGYPYTNYTLIDTSE